MTKLSRDSQLQNRPTQGMSTFKQGHLIQHHNKVPVTFYEK